MELKPIHSKREYQAALAEVERLWDAPAKSTEVLIRPYRLRREAREFEAA